MADTKAYLNQLDREKIPAHVAVIMDGNGRWAKSRGLPRIAGHREGIKSIKRITEVGKDIGIETITLFAFSTENWKRPRQEVDFLMALPQEYLKKELNNLKQNDIQITVMGDLDTLPDKTREVIQEGIDATKNNSSLTLNFAINYGGRQEIVDVCKEIVRQAATAKIDFESIDEKFIQQNLYKPDLPDPDLLIRTSGEQRISNFLLWQLAYTELWFSEVLWPDFQKEHLVQAVLDYQRRKRKFGKI